MCFVKTLTPTTNMLRHILPLLFALASNIALAQYTFSWQPDHLGNGYEMLHIDHGKDYSGNVISTVIRKSAPNTQTSSIKRGVLYVHGFNDYFFNDHMGDKFVSHGYDFYAVDLRKYGRSIIPGQKLFEVRSLREYFADINAAIAEMHKADINEIVLMGHSTGGLIAAYYLSCNPHAPINALILNSPFLDWNLGTLERAVPLVSLWGSIFPCTPIPQGKNTAYAESLLKADHGNWTYNTQWKLPASSDVTAGWVHAIHSAQQTLQHGKADIQVPILLMYSSQSVGGPCWGPDHNRGDAVLDVNDIKKYGIQLGPHVTCLKVNNGLHDLTLSNPAILRNLYPAIFRWLSAHLPQ